MNQAKRRLLIYALKLFDLSLLLAAFAGATMVVISRWGDVPFGDFISMRVKIWNFAIFAALIVAWHVSFASCGLYESKRLTTRFSEMIDVVKASTLATMCLFLIAQTFSVRMFTSIFLAFFWLLSAMAVVVGRVFLRSVLTMLRRHGRNLRYVLILGTNHRSVTFAQKLESNPDLGYRILGFIDEAWSGTPEFLRTGYRLCGSNYSDLETYLRGNVVDEVAIYLPLRSQYEQALRVATLCEQHGITVRFDSDIFGLRLARPRPEWPEDTQQTTIYAGKNHDGWQFMLKRVLDFTLSLAMLALLLPFLILVGAIIKLTSDGPVFFLQERVGRNKRRFLIYKFRTMVPNAEQLLSELEHLNEADGAAFKITSDPRVTRIGKYLRRTSVDELPQLINVLKGEMSLVGPRPLPIRDYENFNQDWQRRRFSVRPGITCLWQTCGRSLVTFDRWMELDMQYLDEWSFWLDIKILARTIPAVWKGSGAV